MQWYGKGKAKGVAHRSGHQGDRQRCAYLTHEYSKPSDGALTKSQFPVFTIYAQKSCLKLRPCERAWCIDRVQGYRLNGHVKRTAQVVSRRDCIEMCLGENEFTCRLNTLDIK
uniref:Apple domain-containing protein n=1 Tax=Anopheles albimanus TaxID=7167 RepID=A0A182F6L9_ANOAL